MKISISFLPGEEAKAYFLAALIGKHFPKAKQKETTKEPPRHHIYFRLPEPGDKKRSSIT